MHHYQIWIFGCTFYSIVIFDVFSKISNWNLLERGFFLLVWTLCQCLNLDGFGDKYIHFCILFLEELMLSFPAFLYCFYCIFSTEIIGLVFQFCSFLFRFKALLSSKPSSDSTCIEINYVKYPIFQVQSSCWIWMELVQGTPCMPCPN